MSLIYIVFNYARGSFLRALWCLSFLPPFKFPPTKRFCKPISKWPLSFFLFMQSSKKWRGRIASLFHLFSMHWINFYVFKTLVLLPIFFWSLSWFTKGQFCSITGHRKRFDNLMFPMPYSTALKGTKISFFLKRPAPFSNPEADFITRFCGCCRNDVISFCILSLFTKNKQLTFQFFSSPTISWL